MRKRLLVPLVAVLLAPLAGAQVPAAAPTRMAVLTDWAEAGLIGRVRRLDATTTFNPAHSIRKLSEFDARGYLSSEVFTSTYKGRVTMTRTAYRTDPAGRKLAADSTRADGTPVETASFGYERLYLVREERRAASGSDSTTTFRYDVSGRLVARETVGGIRTTVAYRYSPSGVPVEATTVFHSGGSPATTVETHDSRGLVVRLVSTRNLNGRKLESKRELEHELDARGNWVARIEYEVDGSRRTPATRETRRISYYP